MLFQQRAQVLGDIRHVVEIGNAANIEPVPDLADAHLDLTLGHALLNEGAAKFFARKADQRGLFGQFKNGLRRGCRRGKIETDHKRLFLGRGTKRGPAHHLRGS